MSGALLHFFLLPLFFLLALSLPAYFCALLYMPVFEKMIGKKEEDEDRPWILEDIDIEDNDLDGKDNKSE